MTTDAAELRKQRPAFGSGDCQRAVTGAVRAHTNGAQTCHVGGERIQIGVAPGFGLAQGSRGLRERCVRHQPGAAKHSADVAFKVVNLIEIRAPVNAPVGAATTPAQIDRIAQAFTGIAEIPDAAVFAAIMMATGATLVVLPCQPWILGIMEKLFAAYHRIAQPFGIREPDCRQEREIR